MIQEIQFTPPPILWLSKIHYQQAGKSRTVTHDDFLSLTHNHILISAGISQFPRHWDSPHRICFLVGHISQFGGVPSTLRT